MNMFSYTCTHTDVGMSCALCIMSMIDPCHMLKNPANVVGQIDLPCFETEY